MRADREAVEDFDRQAAGIGVGLEHDRRHGADQHRLGDAAMRLAMAGDIAGDLAAAGRMTDMDGILRSSMASSAASAA
jgi:hypothetical protein